MVPKDTSVGPDGRRRTRCGLADRRTEVCSGTWPGVDFENSIISPDRQVVVAQTPPAGVAGVLVISPSLPKGMWTGSGALSVAHATIAT